MSPKSAPTPTKPVKARRPLPAWAWGVIPVLSLAFLATLTELRVKRVLEVSGHAGWSSADRPGSAGSWRPGLIVPGNLNASFEWLDQARLMLTTGELRIRHVDYENAPFGHDVRSPSPYRWWLGGLAWVLHAVSGAPLGASLETASLYADPLLALVLIVSVAAFAWRRWGPAAANAACVASALLFPFCVAFLPGAPDDQGLVLLGVIWSLLLLVAGVAAGPGARRWFVASGVVAGLGLWIGVSFEAPIVVGMALGGVATAWIARRARDPSFARLPWRLWAAAGACTSLVAYLVEYFPSHLGSWDLHAVHPLYGIAWLGLGELLTVATALVSGVPAARGPNRWVSTFLGIAGLASIPAALLLTHTSGFLSSDLQLLRLDRMPGGASSSHLLSWIIREGWSASVLGALLPLAMIVPAVLLLVRASTGAAQRAALALVLGPLLVAVGFACVRLAWWNAVDGALVVLCLLVAASLAGQGMPRFLLPAFAVAGGALLATGISEALPHVGSGDAMDEPEVVGLIERDLARWLALRAPPEGAVILAPPNLSTALYYYGGLKGLGTLDWENQDGIQAAVRMVSATTPDEALDLFTRRGVNAVVIPSWDGQLDAFARLGLGKLEGSFINGLHQWALPPWLRPVPYPLPVIGGFEGQSVVIMEVTDEQDNALLLSRIAAYLVETDSLELAGSAADSLRRFQSDLGALVARAEVLVARQQTEEFGRTVEAIIPRLSGPAERALPWDRKVSLSVVLAQGHHVDRARAELAKCLDEVTDEKLRSLSAGSLYHLNVLTRALRLEIADPKLRQLSLDLLPPDLERKLAQ